MLKMFKYVLCLFLTAVFVSTLNASLTDGLVAHYEFEGNANDSSGNGNHGIEYGGVSYMSGVIGQAGSFDGVDDYISVSHNSIFNLSNSFTISVWVKISSDAPDSIRIIDKASGGTCNGWNFDTYDSNQPGFRMRLDVSCPWINSTNAFNAGEWQHLLVSVNNRQATFYLNAQTDGSGSISQPPSNSLDLYIGAPHPATSGMFKGEIDDLRIYNRALSETEIQQLFTIGSKDKVVYSENFSTDPNYTSNDTNNVYWDFNQENYYAKVFDVSSGLGKYVGLSPIFTRIDPDSESFTVEFDFNPVRPNWGTYPFIAFIDDSLFDINSNSLLGVAFQFNNSWEDSYGKHLNLLVKTNPSKWAKWPSILTTENVWYHVKINHSVVTHKLNLLVTYKSNNAVYNQVLDISSDGLPSFNRLFIGGWQSPPKYGTYGVIRVDNISIINNNVIEQNANIKPIISTLNIPYHTEIKPDQFSVYIKNIAGFDSSLLSASIDGAPVNVLSTTSHTDGSIRIDLPFILTEGSQTVALKYGDSTANIFVNAYTVPFRTSDEYWAFEYEASAEAEWGAMFEASIAGLDFKTSSGVAANVEVGLSKNGSANTLVSTDRYEGEFLYGYPKSVRLKTSVEANDFKISVSSDAIPIQAEASGLSGEAGIVASVKEIYYPNKLIYPDDINNIAAYALPAMLSSLPIDLFGSTQKVMIEATGSTPYRHVFWREFELYAGASLFTETWSVGSSNDKVEVKLPGLSSGYSVGQIDALAKWVWIDGQENQQNIDLLREVYKTGVSALQLKLTDLWSGDLGVSKVYYFERGIDKDQYVARLRLKLDSKTEYDALQSNAEFIYNDITYKLNASDYNSLKDDFSISTLARHNFASPTPIESWLLTDDEGSTFKLIKLKATLGVGLGGGINLLTNSHEKALAGFGYRLGTTVYPIYHNVLDITSPVAFRSVDMRKDKGHDILIKSLAATGAQIKEKFKEAIIGYLNTAIQVVDNTVEKAKKVYDGTKKVAEVIGDTFQNVTFNVYGLGQSLLRSTTTRTTPLINNANLSFKSDMIEIAFDKNATESVEAILYPVDGVMDNVGVFQFKENRWQPIVGAIAKNGGLSFTATETGYYALIKHHVVANAIFDKETVSIDTDTQVSLLSNVIKLSDGSIAQNVDFNISVLNAYTIEENQTVFNKVPFSWNEIVQTDNSGMLQINLDTNSSEGYARIEARAVSGYARDELQVFVSKPSTPSIVDDFNITIALDNVNLLIGETIDANVTVVADGGFSDINVTIIAPDGSVIEDHNATVNSPGNWTVDVRAQDVNGFTHTKQQKVKVSYVCSYTVSANKLVYDIQGGEGNVTVASTPFGCNGGSWTANKNRSWISLDGNVSGSGVGEWNFTYDVEANSGYESRSAEIQVDDKNITIEQAAKIKPDVNIAPIIQYLLF